MKRLILLTSLVCRAAIGVTEPVAEISSTANAASYAFGAFTPSAGSVLVMIVAVSGSVVTTATGTGGLIWTQKCAVTFNTTDRLFVLWAKVPTGTGSLTISIDVTGDNGTGAVGGMFQFTDVDLITRDPIRQCATNATTAANPVATFASSMITTNGYAAGFGMPRNPPTSAAPASWTETYDAGQGTPAQGGSGGFRAGGETGTTVTFTSASAAYGIAAVEVFVTGAGPSSRRSIIVQ